MKNAAPDMPAPTLDPATWLDEHGEYLYRCAMKRVRDAHLAEELVQDTLLAAIEGADRFEHRSTVRTWLVGILKRKAIDLVRRASRGPKMVTDLPERVVEDCFTAKGKWRSAPAVWPRVSSGSDGEDFRLAMATCLAKLPPTVADAFVLTERQDLSGKVVAEMLGVTTNHLWVMLYRARTALRGCLDETWVDATASRRRARESS